MFLETRATKKKKNNLLLSSKISFKTIGLWNFNLIDSIILYRLKISLFKFLFFQNSSELCFNLATIQSYREPFISTHVA